MPYSLNAPATHAEINRFWKGFFVTTKNSIGEMVSTVLKNYISDAEIAAMRKENYSRKNPGYYDEEEGVNIGPPDYVEHLNFETLSLAERYSYFAGKWFDYTMIAITVGAAFGALFCGPAAGPVGAGIGAGAFAALAGIFPFGMSIAPLLPLLAYLTLPFLAIGGAVLTATSIVADAFLLVGRRLVGLPVIEKTDAVTPVEHTVESAPRRDSVASIKQRLVTDGAEMSETMEEDKKSLYEEAFETLSMGGPLFQAESASAPDELAILPTFGPGLEPGSP